VSLVERAALDNAHWCDCVVGAHGGTGTFRADAWTSRRRTPNGYPDAVTLRPDANAALLEAVDSGPGCSVKDSFALLDLERCGFEVLFEAQWIALTEPALRAATLDWGEARGPDAVDHWEVNALTAGVLDAVGVTPLLGRRDGDVVAGAIMSAMTGSTGISNVFASPDLTEVVWAELAVVVPELRPRAPVVGYERGYRLAAACAAGFSAIGPLRVWHRP